MMTKLGLDQLMTIFDEIFERPEMAATQPPRPPGRVSCLMGYHALRMPGLPSIVREIRPWPMTAEYRSAVMQWCTDHLLVPTDVGYLIELSDGRVVVKLYDRDENGRPFLRKGEPAHCWRCVTPKRPLPV